MRCFKDMKPTRYAHLFPIFINGFSSKQIRESIQQCPKLMNFLVSEPKCNIPERFCLIIRYVLDDLQELPFRENVIVYCSFPSNCTTKQMFVVL